MSNSELTAATLEPVEALATRWTRSRHALRRRNKKLVSTVSRAVEESKGAAVDYIAFLRGERERWRAFASERRVALRSPAVRKVAWMGAQHALGTLQHRIAERVAELDKPTLPIEIEVLPIEDYDAKNARDLTSALTELDADALRTVERYERAHKGRVTVLRAVERRLAA